MKKNKFFFIALIVINTTACTKSTPKEKPEVQLKGGTWNLTKFQKENISWKDSTGIFYKFSSDTTVLTNRYNPPCSGFYEAANSSGLKTITITFWYCKPSANHAFSIESIEGDNMIIFYSDEIAGNIVHFKEQYLRQ